MKNWRNTLVLPGTTILDALEIMDSAAVQIILIADTTDRLIGTVTDGDIRRCILRGVPLSASIENAANRSPVVATPEMDEAAIYAMMADSHVHQIPLVDGKGRVIGLRVFDELMAPDAVAENCVVIMAGGLGTRLRPLTDEAPKPLLKVGGRPILETIVVNLRRQGFRRIYIAVNYKAEMVKEYFGVGENWNVTIHYLEERERLGTAGALGLLKELPGRPLIVMNGDLLTSVNFHSMLDFHRQSHATVTVGVREYDVKVPFGVVNLDGSSIRSLEEKPVRSYLINAGIYVVDPSAVASINGSEPLDMTELIAGLLARGETVTAFPIREYWLDIGRMDDFVVAKQEFSKFFD